MGGYGADLSMIHAVFGIDILMLHSIIWYDFSWQINTSKTKQTKLLLLAQSTKRVFQMQRPNFDQNIVLISYLSWIIWMHSAWQLISSPMAVSSSTRCCRQRRTTSSHPLHKTELLYSPNNPLDRVWRVWLNSCYKRFYSLVWPASALRTINLFINKATVGS